MKRVIIFGLLAACSDSPVSPPVPCQPLTCADFHQDALQVCGAVYDGCGKDLDCGPCDASDLGGGGSSGSSCSLEAGSSSVSSTGSGSSSSGSLGEGGSNTCEDLVFEK